MRVQWADTTDQYPVFELSSQFETIYAVAVSWPMSLGLIYSFISSGVHSYNGAKVKF